MCLGSTCVCVCVGCTHVIVCVCVLRQYVCVCVCVCRLYTCGYAHVTAFSVRVLGLNTCVSMHDSEYVV